MKEEQRKERAMTDKCPETWRPGGNTQTESRQKRAERLLETCREILRIEGIPASENIAGIKINDRIRSRFGSCRKERNAAGPEKKAGAGTRPGKGTADSAVFHIEISGRMMLCREDKDIETVLLHELLHTCPRCMNHGAKWKGYAEKLNKKYGYNIRAAARYEDFGLEEPGSRESVKYHIVCTGCGLEMRRKRRCPLVENIGRYRCGKCGGKLEIR